jgi:hypothetical protein
MAGTVNDPGQLAFVQKVLAEPGNAGKRIIVLTHHNAIAYDGLSINTRTDGSLLNDVFTALGKQLPPYWYYGHIHNGIVYNDKSIAGTLNLKPPGGHPKFRCFGHAAIPFGDGYGFSQNNAAAGIDYYAKTPMGTTDPRQQNRVLNGFTLLTLRAGGITEEVYEVANAGNGAYKLTRVWGETSSSAAT